MAIRSADWDLFRSFLEVMRQGSLSGAARALGMTQPSVGRHISSLEDQLGARLFFRNQEGLSAMPLAEQLLPFAEAMATSAKQIQSIAAAGERENRCTIRVSASQMIGGEVLPRMLADYPILQSGTSIELIVSNETDDILRREADIAVRMTEPHQQSLIAQRIGRVSMGLYAHQSYIRRRGIPSTLEDLLANHVLIGFDENPFMEDIARQLGVPFCRENIILRTDNELAQLTALRTGLGVGGCHTGIAKYYPELIPVLPFNLPIGLDMWLVIHSDLRPDKRVMMLFTYLKDQLKEYVQASTSSTL